MSLLMFRKKHDRLERQLATAIAASAAEPAVEDEPPPPQRSLLEQHAASIERLLVSMQNDSSHLEEQIAEKQERLRQLRVSIEAFQLALRRILS